MKGINLTRVLLGGLAAGVVINLGEFVLWGLLFQEQYQAMMAAYGLTEASWAMIAYVAGAFILGLTLAFTYAAIRPRFGARWQTGVVAASIVWVVGAALPMVFNGAVGLGFGAGASTVALVWALVEFGVAGVVAGWAYQEQAAAAPATATAPTF